VLVAPFTSGSTLLLVVIAGGVGVGTVWTNTDMIVSGLARQGQIAATLGVVGSFKELGDMLGPLLIGILTQLFGIRVAFVTCGILGLATLGLFKAVRLSRTR